MSATLRGLAVSAGLRLTAEDLHALAQFLAGLGELTADTEVCLAPDDYFSVIIGESSARIRVGWDDDRGEYAMDEAVADG